MHYYNHVTKILIFGMVIEKRICLSYNKIAIEFFEKERKEISYGRKY